MTSDNGDNDDCCKSRPLTRAEVYSIALRRLAAMKDGEDVRSPSVPVASPDMEFPDPRLRPGEWDETRLAYVQSQAGWRKLILPRDGTMTLADMQNVFAMAFTAAGSPAGAAMYQARQPEADWTLYFSPAALKVFGSVMLLKGATDCDRPMEGSMTLLCGTEPR